MKTILEECKDVLEAQTEKGVSKYGTDLDGANLPVIEVLKHLREELADGMQYVTKVIRMLEDREGNKGIPNHPFDGVFMEFQSFMDAAKIPK